MFNLKIERLIVDKRSLVNQMHIADMPSGDYKEDLYTKYKFLKEYIAYRKEKDPCKQCGKRFKYYQMCFKHRVGTEKKFTISEATNFKRLVRIDELVDEMDKCDLLCMNCSRVKNEFNNDSQKQETQ